MPKATIDAFVRLMKLPYGAKYHKVDFHFHTPASSDARGRRGYDFNPYAAPLYVPPEEVEPHSWAYADGLRRAQRRVLDDARAHADTIIDHFLDHGLRMVAITDHNSLGTIWPIPAGKTMDLAAPTWYELLDEAAARRAAQGRQRVVILPGTEVSTAGVHILGVFPPTEPRREIHLVISSLLVEIGIEVTNFGHNPRIGHASPVDTIDMIQRRGGVAILAHVDATNKALFRLHPIGSSELAVVLTDPKLHAVEMVEPRKLSKVPRELSKKGKSLGQWILDVREKAGLDGLAYFQGSDAHGLGRIGARYSYLMMSSPSFAGLRDALLSPSSRVRVGDMVTKAPTARWYVYGFEIDHPLFGRQRARFNHNLNCVVGGTDCGKSVLLGLLRKAVCESSELRGTVKLFIERRDGDQIHHYCFSRRGDAVELSELVRGPRGGYAAKLVPAEDPAHQALRPRFYDSQRMHALISSKHELRELLIRDYGEPSATRVAKFNASFDLPKFLSADPCPLLQLGLDKRGDYELYINLNWRRRGATRLRRFDRCSASLQRLIIMIMVLVSGRSGPVIIDDPADEFDSPDISAILVPLVKLLKGRGQLILATKNANLAINADPENYLVLERKAGAKKVKIDSGFAIDDEQRRERLIELLEGDLASFERRRKLYAPPPEAVG